MALAWQQPSPWFQDTMECGCNFKQEPYGPPWIYINESNINLIPRHSETEIIRKMTSAISWILYLCCSRRRKRAISYHTGQYPIEIELKNNGPNVTFPVSASNFTSRNKRKVGNMSIREVSSYEIHLKRGYKFDVSWNKGVLLKSIM